MAVAYCFCVQLRRRYDAQLGVLLPVIFVEKLVCVVVGPSEQKVRIEGSKFSEEDISAIDLASVPGV
jgi:hypothetical protein